LYQYFHNIFLATVLQVIVPTSGPLYLKALLLLRQQRGVMR